MRDPHRGVAMTNSNFSISKWLGFSLEFLAQLMLVTAIFMFGVISWPDGIFEAPLAQMPLSAAIAAGTSLLAFAVGLSGLYLVAVEAFSRSCEQLRSRARE